MGKSTTNLSGAQLTTFCRELFASSLDGDGAVADLLVRDFAEHVTAIRVRRNRVAKIAKRRQIGAAQPPADTAIAGSPVDAAAIEPAVATPPPEQPAAEVAKASPSPVPSQPVVSVPVVAEPVQPPVVSVPFADAPAVSPAAEPAPVVVVATEPGEQPFDPYAFSVIAMMSKKGRDALGKRLAEIKKAAHLKELAEAQGLAIDDATLAATDEALDDLRLAIVKAAERRIADRRAAAS